MNKHLLVLSIMVVFAVALGLACADNEWDKPPQHVQDDGSLDAKDRDYNLSCEETGARVEDCYDACSCCLGGQEDNMQLCVGSCDKWLMELEGPDIDPTKTDYERFIWCSLGCYSLCPVDQINYYETVHACREECLDYIRGY
jgi:hypothetical protein